MGQKGNFNSQQKEGEMEIEKTSPEILLKGSGIGHKFDYLLFRQVDLELKEGDRIAIVGSSGSGKSTLLHILSTFLPPLEGKVELFGKEIYSLSQEELIKIRREQIGIIFQFHYLFSSFTGWENLEVASLLAEKSIDLQLLERLGIEKVLYQNIQTLSGGQQQRVSIARVLTKGPRLIFADEPTGNLDRQNGLEVLKILEEYIQQVKGALVVVTHDREIADRFPKIYRLENKTLLPLR